MNSRNTKTGCQDLGGPAPRGLSSSSVQSFYRVTAQCLAAIAVLPCMPLAYYTHDPSQIVRCPLYQTKQPLTGARIRAPENVFKWWAGETHLPNMCRLAFCQTEKMEGRTRVSIQSMERGMQALST